MTAAPAPRIAALSAALALPLALMSATPAAADTVGVTTWDQLEAAFLVDGDTIRLDADIDAGAGESLVIEDGESIILDLNGFALDITEPADGDAAISVPPTSDLTINDTGGGTLTATGGEDAAGIGGGAGGDSGTITINGGTTTATGGDDAAGIGGGFAGNSGTTTINGGTTTATGGDDAAGIGGGFARDNGTTTINGGITTATGGLRGAGIGGGDGGNGGTTTINGGTTTATSGSDAAGIGGGNFGETGSLQVNGTPDDGAATNGGGDFASPISNPTTPAGVGYSAATTSTVDDGGRIELRFNYLITFTANGGSTTAPQTIDDGVALTEPAEPTREGFTFTEWTSEGSAYDFSTPVTEPLELTATWTAVLADTGAEVATTAGIASLLVAGGVILIALRRRPSARSA